LEVYVFFNTKEVGKNRNIWSTKVKLCDIVAISAAVSLILFTGSLVQMDTWRVSVPTTIIKVKAVMEIKGTIRKISTTRILPHYLVFSCKMFHSAGQKGVLFDNMMKIILCQMAK